MCLRCGLRVRGASGERPSSAKDKCFLGGRYRVLSYLGGGGFGSVFLAEDLELREQVALKLLRPELTRNDRVLERFRREIRIARKLSHPNIVRLHELHREDDMLFFTMEYLQGHDLKTLIRDNTVPDPARRLTLALDVCGGLSYAHAASVIHRDIKSSNIFVTPDGVPKILDFGLSISRDTQGITETGAMLGTPDYMSPEQVRGEPCTQQSDIYSMGVVLFELFTGELPFTGDTPMAAAVKRLLEDPPDPRKTGSGAADSVARVVEKALARDRKRRYARVDDMETELRLCLSSLPVRGRPRGTRTARARAAPQRPREGSVRGPAAPSQSAHGPEPVAKNQSTLDLISKRESAGSGTLVTELSAPSSADALDLLSLILDRAQQADEAMIGPDAAYIRSGSSTERLFDLAGHAGPVVAEVKRLSAGIDSGFRGTQEGRLDASRVSRSLSGTFRVFILSGRGSERAVLKRIARRDPGLDPAILGIPEAAKTAFLTLVGSKRGLVIAAGPAQCGKTTTALSLLTLASATGVAAMAASERIDLQAAEIVQVEVSPDEGVPWDKALESFEAREAAVILADGRQPPWETLLRLAAGKALVVACVEAASLPGVFSALLPACVKPADLAPALQLVVFQLLVPTVCHACRKPATASAALLRRIAELSGEETPAPAVGPGCLACMNTGQGEPTPVFHAVAVETPHREWVRAGCSAETAPADFGHFGRSQVAKDLARLAASGIISPHQFSRVLGG